MPPTLTTRKPITNLDVEDLIAFPIWEYASGEEIEGADETWIRPVNRRKISKKLYSQIVASDFRLASGRVAEGFMLVTTAVEPAEVKPGALVVPKYLTLPSVSRSIAIKQGFTWSLQERDRLFGILQLSEQDVFPIHYQLKALVASEEEFRNGVIE